MLDLSQMKQLEAKATKGPWVAEERGGNPSGGMYEFEPGDRMVVGWEYMDDFADDHNDVAECWSWDNMQFIAASRTWIPEAIAEIERLRAESEHWQAMYEKVNIA